MRLNCIHLTVYITFLCNISHFYIFKHGVYRGKPIFFLFLIQNIDCGAH